jgi:hypothetical protein
MLGPSARAAALLLAALLSVRCTASPGAPSEWVGPFDAPTVLTRAIAAVGGPDALVPPATLHTRSRIELHPPPAAALAQRVEGELEYWSDGETRERRELVTQDGLTLVQVVNGERTVELENGRPTRRDLHGDFAQRRRCNRLLLDLAAPGDAPAQLVAVEGVDRERTVAVERTFGRERWQAWLDAKSLLLVRIRRIAHESDGDHVDEDQLDEWTHLGSRLVPRHHRTWRDGRPRTEAWLLDYAEGAAIDPALFDCDAAARTD